MAFSYFNFPCATEFYQANALHRFGLSSRYQFNKIVQLALRVIPVLDYHNSRVLLETARKEFEDKEAYFVVSYVSPEGPVFEKSDKCSANLNQPSNMPLRKESFEDGGIVTFYQEKDVVLNTYFKRESFSSLAESCKFDVKTTIEVEERSGSKRNVVLLVPQGKT